MSTLPRTSPESVGIASKDILDFINAVEAAEQELHSFMLLRHGNVAAEGWWAPYRKDDIHLLYSLSKSFTSTAIGFAIQEELVRLDDPVISFFPDKLPANLSEKLQALKVRHLLSMSTGHSTDTIPGMRIDPDEDWVRGFLAQDIEFEPGTHFLYNNGATYMLSAIVTKVSGISALDYLRPRLFDPLGIEKATWTACPKGISVGASELRITTDSIARFGQLYLQKGMWNGTRLLSDEWVEQATSFQVSNASNDQPDWKVGYGFQFWRCQTDCYRGDGAFGQYCIVMPQTDMVVAITAAVSSMQTVLDLVWKHLLLPEKPESLPENAAELDALKAHLTMLEIPGPIGKPISDLAKNFTGRMYKNVESESQIKTLTFDFDSQGCLLTTRTESGDRSLRIGSSKWIHGSWSVGNEPPTQFAAIGRWTSDNTYEFKLRYTNSPSGATTVCTFEGNSVKHVTTLTSRFGNPEPTTFEGMAKKIGG